MSKTKANKLPPTKKPTTATKKAPAKKVAAKKSAPKQPSKCIITIMDDAKLGVRIGVQFTPVLPAKGKLSPAQNFAISLLEEVTDIVGIESLGEE
jgi:hypothetical protein